MRQITREACEAFVNNREFRKSNTVVGKIGDTVTMKLFGNIIAIKNQFGTTISNAGYATVTSKERLNGLLGILGKQFRIWQKAGKWYYHDKNGQVCPFPNYDFVNIDNFQ